MAISKIKGSQIAQDGSSIITQADGDLAVGVIPTSQVTTGSFVAQIGTSGTSGLTGGVNTNNATSTLQLDLSALTGQSTLEGTDGFGFDDAGTTKLITLTELLTQIAGSGISTSGTSLSTSGSDQTIYGITDFSAEEQGVVSGLIAATAAAKGTYGTGGISNFGVNVLDMSGETTSDVKIFARRLSNSTGSQSVDCYFYQANATSIVAADGAFKYRPTNNYVQVFLNGVQQDVVVGHETGFKLVVTETSCDSAVHVIGSPPQNDDLITALTQGGADCAYLLDTKLQKAYVAFRTTDIVSGDIISIID